MKETGCSRGELSIMVEEKKGKTAQKGARKRTTAFKKGALPGGKKKKGKSSGTISRKERASWWWSDLRKRKKPVILKSELNFLRREKKGTSQKRGGERVQRLFPELQPVGEGNWRKRKDTAGKRKGDWKNHARCKRKKGTPWAQESWKANGLAVEAKSLTIKERRGPSNLHSREGESWGKVKPVFPLLFQKDSVKRGGKTGRSHERIAELVIAAGKMPERKKEEKRSIIAGPGSGRGCIGSWAEQRPGERGRRAMHGRKDKKLSFKNA